MNLVICGLLDIILVIGAIVVSIIGYKRGFVDRVTSLFGFLAILVFSVVFCSVFANMLIQNGIIYNDILANFLQRTEAAEAVLGEGSFAGDILGQAFNLFGWIGTLICKFRGFYEGETQAFIAADAMAQLAMKGISFGIIFVGSLIALLIIRIISSVARSLTLFRVVDGIFGIILMLILYLVVVLLLSFILNIFMPMDWFSGARDWLIVDMQLNTDAFRISKAIYLGNFITHFINLFF